MLPLAVEGDLLVQGPNLPVHPDAHVAHALCVVEDLLVLALFCPDHRREEDDLRALRQHQERIHDLVDRLFLDLAAALGAVGNADAGKEKPQVVVDLRHGSDRGARVPVGGLLLDGDGGRQALDVVEVRLVQPAEELPRVGGEGFDVPALSLGEHRVEGKG